MNTNRLLTVTDLPSLFADYYQTADFTVEDIVRREIALQPFGAVGPNIRSLSFQNTADLTAKLLERPPSAVFASVGYYMDPNERQMAKKDIRGYDLVFDIDADNFEGSYYDLVAHLCVSTKILIDTFLVGHFGFKREDMRIEFSGRKGFHVTLTDKALCDLSKEDRRQIIDYVTGKSLNRDLLFPTKLNHPTSPSKSGGWTKLANVWLNAILDETESVNSSELCKAILVKYCVPKKYATKKQGDLLTDPQVRKSLREGRLSSLIGTSEKALNGFVSAVVKYYKQQLGSVIDRRVTADRSRIFRVPGSLHPKSGLPCMTIPYEYLDLPELIFDKAYTVVGEDMVQILLNRFATIDLYEQETFGPGIHEVPRWKAIAILCALYRSRR